MQITAIILAGGKSKRMGKDKAMLKLDGKTLLKRCVKLCEEFTNDIIISSNNPKHSNLGYPVVGDEIENCGPIGGIYSSLKQSGNKWNFVISVDAAFVEFDFIAFLADFTENYEAVVPFTLKGKEPLIAFYNKNILPLVEERVKSGDYKMHNLVSEINTNFVDSQMWVERYTRLFHNLNKPEDL